MKMFVAGLAFALFLSSCSSSKNYSPYKQFPKQKLQKDYLLLRNILETKHPSLYWYTSKDSMDYYFDKYYLSIKDSMTEQQFAWRILSPLIDKIHCGHTSVGRSKDYVRWSKNRKLPSFPLYFKVWKDSMAVTANLNKRDSIFKPGVLVTAINKLSNMQLISTMFSYLPEDGYADNVNYMRLSGNFPYFYKNIYGLTNKFSIDYLDSTGAAKTATIPLYIPPEKTKKDTADKRIKTKLPPKPPKSDKLEVFRSLKIDSSRTAAVMTVNTFTKGHLRSFFKRSFRIIRKENINNLVIDLRLNGGGRVALSTLLTRYVTRQPFKVADTLVTQGKTLRPYSRYIKGNFLNDIQLFFVAHKKADGRYHLTHLESKVYKPKTPNNFTGNLYVLTSGLTFSASALFCNAVKGQQAVTLVGEETGGGWHGNNGIMIPDIVLPETKLKVRLPLFRLVQYNHVPKTGTGVMPDVLVPPNYEALKKGIDYKIKITRNLIDASEKNK